METLIDTESYVFHIEVDISDPLMLLFSDKHAIKATDGNATDLLVGSAHRSGYTEGVGSIARFNLIIGFAQLNKTTVVALDHGNHCLRLVDRKSLKTSSFVGMCQTEGSKDGTNALFNSPGSVIKYLGSDGKLLVLDQKNHVIREVDIDRRITSTITPKQGSFSYPTSFSFDVFGQNLLVTGWHGVSFFNLTSRVITNMTGSQNGGFADGSLAEAKFQYPREITQLSGNIMAVADMWNNRVRLINTVIDAVTSLCDGNRESKDGFPHSCSLSSPYSVMAHNGTLYIGQSEAIRAVPCESKEAILIISLVQPVTHRSMVPYLILV